jgi:hypothetical protein
MEAPVAGCRQVPTRTKVVSAVAILEQMARTYQVLRVGPARHRRSDLPARDRQGDQVPALVPIRRAARAPAF